MGKLSKWLNFLDNNLIKILVFVFVFLIPLYPKFPIRLIDYTYIGIRAEDIYIAIATVLFGIQILRKKVVIDWKMMKWFALFWLVVFTSYLLGFYVFHTVRINQVGFLNAARRVEYMIMFFMAFATIKTRKDFFMYLYAIATAVTITCLYGIGQKFAGFPAMSTMNPEFAKGQLLYLTPEARVSSTFAGHYDLAAYLVFLMPIMVALHLYTKKIVFFGTFMLGLTTLMLTASRISFIAYVVSFLAFLIYVRKPKYLIIVAVVTVLATLGSSNLTSRFLKTFQVRQIFVNEKTGQVVVPQNITTKELPSGSFYVQINKNKPVETTDQSEKLMQKQVLEDIRKEASKDGRVLTASQEAAMLATKSASLTAVNSVTADISFAARLEVEWPRAINALKKNPLFGTGPSSITESTDNDFLRWLGETGLLGTGLFSYIIFMLVQRSFYATKVLKGREDIILYGYIFGVGALLINASYIDVFEASKVAYTFWTVSGLVMGALPVLIASKNDVQPAVKTAKKDKSKQK